uniref:Uncharacterized protein n=1 Tax=Plectus sambesii TaxID=2011161 RepID=A0A914VY02_9BILA
MSVKVTELVVGYEAARIYLGLGGGLHVVANRMGRAQWTGSAVTRRRSRLRRAAINQWSGSGRRWVCARRPSHSSTPARRRSLAAGQQQIDQSTTTRNSGQLGAAIMY